MPQSCLSPEPSLRRQNVLDPVLRRDVGQSHWTRLHGCAASLAAAQLVRRMEHSPLLVLLPTSLSACDFHCELSFFLRGSDIPIYYFPDLETLPYDALSPSQALVSERLKTLYAMPDLGQAAVIAPMNAVLHRLMPGDLLSARVFSLAEGEELDREKFLRDMASSGYRRVNQVMEHGDIALRGSLIDFFPMGFDVPVRVDLLDEEIQSIRRFDPDTQRSGERCAELRILPTQEVDFSDQGIALFRKQWRECFDGNPLDCRVYHDTSQKILSPGVEQFLPLFYQETWTLFDYLPNEAVVMLDADCPDALATFHQEAVDRHVACASESAPALAPKDLFLSETDFFSHAKRLHQVRIAAPHQDRTQAIEYASAMPPQLPIDVRVPHPMKVVASHLEKYAGRTLFAVGSAGRCETLLEQFAAEKMPAPDIVEGWEDFVQGNMQRAVCIADLERGLFLQEPMLSVVCDAQLFGERIKRGLSRRRAKGYDPDKIVRNLSELAPGAPIVHIDHGVGIYLGLKCLDLGGIQTEFLRLEYADGDKLYVPVTSLDLIARYTGVDPERAPLHKLGGGQWEKVRRRALRQVYDVAAELLDINARRALRKRQSYKVDEIALQVFERGFSFTETPDQEEAIRMTLADMQDGKPMDRLLCGDAGFGKTEVALRASFVAVDNARQVLVLAPTTLLAQQHWQTFRDRFADMPVRIEVLSRFRTGGQRDATVVALEEGKVDIIIGTHRLLQGDIRPPNLGLLIIDEEHRFGVRQKEKIKALRSEVDVLSLSATPIPRTLNMAMSSLRSFSVISTPPLNRQEIRTFVREWDETAVRDALNREIKRGGQAFFLHNEVKSIERIARDVQRICPSASVCIAHGQMPGRELEAIMLNFQHRRFNVLVCSTIIEMGIDIPNANTIIINRADRFGLAQLYQLRGRVGRSHHRAYAWLMIPQGSSLSEDAKKRLAAISSLEGLGVGFTLAVNDLEIRGAGEILGQEQSGHIQALGFSMYMDVLGRTLEAMQAGKQLNLDRPLDHGVEINLHVPALLSEDYLPDVQMRLVMYKRIASAGNYQELLELREEMIDRFGVLSEPAQALFGIAKLKLKTNSLGIERIEMDAQYGHVAFRKNPNIDPEKIIKLIQSKPDRYRLDNSNRIHFLRGGWGEDAASRLRLLDEFFDHLLL